MDLNQRAGLHDRLALLSDWIACGRRAQRPRLEFELPPGPAPADRNPAFLGKDGSFTPEDLAVIEGEVDRCARCRLAANRRHTAFGEGVLNPAVLVVGEAPGEEEDKAGRPFVGPAGRLLDRMLAAVDLDRSRNCYISNIVKCRPPMNRDPAPDERAECLPFLERQIRFLRPPVILVLGRVAAQALLRTEKGVASLRGDFRDRDGVPVLVTYHPSAILRDETLKRPAWEDLKRLRAFLDRAKPA
ncbi:MAG TPA: uracil-DNA glycosylase [Magnetospirillaceae bacterium]|nr:uracil-DNA glycosylase [Magnetospirillaceae bacterium]